MAAHTQIGRATRRSSDLIVTDPVSSSTQCINFGTGNIQVSSYVSSNTISIGGLVDGGAYTDRKSYTTLFRSHCDRSSVILHPMHQLRYWQYSSIVLCKFEYDLHRRVGRWRRIHRSEELHDALPISL